ncbi:DeoR/GlpR family DNA-binding transcription regulator [Proteiniphilum sp. UBA5480]|jgi:DeoR/GlpR family transcriptional regulator of sugar metabolism|uniref:DeoR/GlpR family DNA-binding transcription regulator n=1 Tax=Dysgonomonadaceae TaxID=2005520 RepID=UPI00257E108E|nr:DeoR/GlpR family DNA-binding transcription regulator [Proteiniphilum sp. UBA5480]MEA5044906.1 DeoR/GlpR family DNA-binding transcription regulator [Petrimonas sp.]HMM18784.1 DeoR/GlpR family DNA-binding transcription regulator [Petrimonas sp.]
MLKEERLKFIMKQINLHNKVLSVDLSVLLDVSEDTIRRDLKELSDSGHIIRVHGGAVSNSLVRPFITDTNVYALYEKREIASKAVKLIENNMTLLFEGGTTIFELTKIIPKKLTLTIFTISPQIAVSLSDYDNIRVFTIGGQLWKNHNIHIGSRTINELNRMSFDLCFMGINALSVERGLTDIDMEVVEVNKAMLNASSKNALLTISEKMNLTKRYQLSDMSDIDYLITELDRNDKLLLPYKQKYTKVEFL